VFVMRARASGPCAFVQSTWTSQHVASARVLWGLVGAMAVAIVATLLGMRVVVRPLLRRIERLRKSAENVGDPKLHSDSMAHAIDDGDELDAVHASLRRAHTRIVDDAKTLADQRDALGRHLADVSHDLRTPIASLQLTLEEIGDRAGDEGARELVAAALRDAVYLGGLVENLRLASLLEANATSATPSPVTDLARVVEAVAERCRIFARRQGASLEVAIPDDAVEVACDPVWVERALANVVENAVTHVGVDGHVAIVLSRAGSRFEIAVLDDGPGVAEGELERLGERTFRSDDARKRDARGSGLGLAITREVCRRYGWEIAFARVEPRGLRVGLGGKVVA
ncbi:MAG: sensor histidine kinase, partial [Polyangiales bacterium]